MFCHMIVILTFFESLKIILLNMVTILTMSAKTACLGLLKIMVFWNKVYDIIIAVQDVTYKILSRKSYCRFGHVTKVW